MIAPSNYAVKLGAMENNLRFSNMLVPFHSLRVIISDKRKGQKTKEFKPNVLLGANLFFHTLRSNQLVRVSPFLPMSSSSPANLHVILRFLAIYL